MATLPQQMSRRSGKVTLDPADKTSNTSLQEAYIADQPTLILSSQAKWASVP